MVKPAMLPITSVVELLRSRKCAESAYVPLVKPSLRILISIKAEDRGAFLQFTGLV